METTSHHTELVHVLPFALRPNERLENALNEFFIKPGSVEPRFLFKTMSSLAIEVTRQHQQVVRKALFDIRQDLDRNPFELELSDQITGRRLATGAFRLYVGLTDSSMRILSENRDKVADLLPSPMLVHEGPYETMKLTTTLPAGLVLETNQEIGRAGLQLKRSLQEEIGSRTYTTVSNGLVGHDEIREINHDIYPQGQAS